MEKGLSPTNVHDPLTPFGWTFGRFFDDVLGRRGDDSERVLAPALDVTEDDHFVTVHAELPGLKKEDVRIQFENGVLTISGEKKYETESKDKSWHRMERRYGSVYRAITLPSGVTTDNADATFEDGVLTVKLPKREDMKPKTLKIK